LVADTGAKGMTSISEIFIENWRILEIFIENWRISEIFHSILENFGGFGEISIEFQRISKIFQGFSRILEVWASPKPFIFIDPHRF